jgi:hypothetical protein
MTARLSAGPRDYKPAAGYMFKKVKKNGKSTFVVRQVFKIQPKMAKYHKTLKGGKGARVIVLGKFMRPSGKIGYKLMHVTDAIKSGWTRVTKRGPTPKMVMDSIRRKKAFKRKTSTY